MKYFGMFMAYILGIPILTLGFGTWLLPMAYSIAIPSILGGCIESGLIPENLSYVVALRISLALVVISAPSLLIKGVIASLSQCMEENP